MSSQISFDVFRSAKRMCADLKTVSFAKNGCGVRTLIDQDPHLSLRCVTFYCATFNSSNPCTHSL
jgi:hypothetical protein